MPTLPHNAKLGRRNRPPTSCEPCRIRKLKCNRGSPCDACVKRNKQTSCEYAGNANRDKPKQRTTGDRLQSLENIVLQFVENGVTGKPPEADYRRAQTADHPGGSTTIDTSTSTDERGTLYVQGGQLNYVDSSHWLSILHDIKEVREQLSSSNPQGQEDQSCDNIGPEPEVDLVFSPLQPPALHEILQSLPSRPICDSLISQYFNSKYMILPIVHPLQFQQEYEQFWEDSSKTPTLWVGLLFAILGIVTTLRQITKMPTEFGGHILYPNVFRLRTTQCLVRGKYSTAKAYALEILLLSLQSNFLGHVGSNINLWFVMGIIIRLAMRMGYHRDSKSHLSISPYDGEMRRRVWAIIFQLDTLMSFQLGLPSMIPSDYCDTAAPRNLAYSDFFPDTAVLPPTRPLSDHTPVLYTVIKSQVMGVFKKIVAHTQSLSTPPLETTIMLDIEMRETYNNLPSHFKSIPVSRSFMDTANTIMERYSIELLYLKGIIVLHRRFLKEDASNPKYAKFRHACLDAAMEILSRQTDLHQASQPGGQLFDDPWVMASLTTYDFLLAAMVVCLELSVHTRTATARGSVEFARQLDALQTSHMIWVSRTMKSRDAHTAAQALELMIKKIVNDEVKKDNPTNLPGSASHKNASHFEDGSFPYTEPVIEMIDGSENLDWTLLDQYFQNNDGLDDFTSPGIYNEEQGRDMFESMGSEWMV